jgi:hypothetical protein
VYELVIKLNVTTCTEKGYTLCIIFICYISLTKQQFFVTHRYTVLQETEKNLTEPNRPTLMQFLCGHNIMTKVVFVTHLSSNAGNLSFTNCVLYDKLLFLSDLMTGISFRESTSLWNVCNTNIRKLHEHYMLLDLSRFDILVVSGIVQSKNSPIPPSEYVEAFPVPRDQTIQAQRQRR